MIAQIGGAVVFVVARFVVDGTSEQSLEQTCVEVHFATVKEYSAECFARTVVNIETKQL